MASGNHHLSTEEECKVLGSHRTSAPDRTSFFFLSCGCLCVCVNGVLCGEGEIDGRS